MTQAVVGKNGSLIKVGDKVKGIHFAYVEGLAFLEEMEKFVGAVGNVVNIYDIEGFTRIVLQFPGSDHMYAYPANLVERIEETSLAKTLDSAKFGDRIAVPDLAYVDHDEIQGKEIIFMRPKDRDGDVLVAYQNEQGHGYTTFVNIKQLVTREEKFNRKNTKPVVDFTPYAKLAAFSIVEHPRGKALVYSQLSRKMVNDYEKQLEFFHYVKDAIIEGKELPTGTLQFLKRMAAVFITQSAAQGVQKTLRLELERQQGALTKLIAYQHRKGAKGETA